MADRGSNEAVFVSGPSLRVEATAEATPLVYLDALKSGEEARLADWLTPEREEALIEQIRATLAALRARVATYLDGDVWPAQRERQGT